MKWRTTSEMGQYLTWRSGMAMVGQPILIE
jgi:hypothetical protein